MDYLLALAINISTCNYYFLNNITVNKNIQVTCKILFYYIARLCIVTGNFVDVFSIGQGVRKNFKEYKYQQG